MSREFPELAIINVPIYWRGSVSDLITDVAGALYPHELQELRMRLNEGEGEKKTKPYPKRGESL